MEFAIKIFVAVCIKLLENFYGSFHFKFFNDKTIQASTTLRQAQGDSAKLCWTALLVRILNNLRVVTKYIAVYR